MTHNRLVAGSSPAGATKSTPSKDKLRQVKQSKPAPDKERGFFIVQFGPV